jgi:hypothetical protein
MTRRARQGARGPGGATGAPAADTRPWWARSWPAAHSVGDVRVAALPADTRGDARLDALATAAAAIQRATDQDDVFAAAASAVELRGLSGHLAALERGGAFLVIRKTVLPWAHQAELERIHGAPLVGSRVELASGSAHATAVEQGRSMHTTVALAWVLGTAEAIGPAEADAIGAFVGLGEALLVPITDGREVFGVLTVWSLSLSRADRALCEILCRLAGGALAGQRARDVAWRGAPTLAA